MKLTYSFKKVVRQNTGAHPLDSGGAYGRHHERPLSKVPITLRKEEFRGKLEFTATINLSAFLNETLEIDQRLTKSFQTFADKRDESYRESVDAWAKKRGLKVVDWDNAYNHENDLDQVFQYAVLSESIDWIGDPSTLVVVQSHNGCDVRGGYQHTCYLPSLRVRYGILGLRHWLGVSEREGCER